LKTNSEQRLKTWAIFGLSKASWSVSRRLPENEIRIQYTGFIIFAAQILSIATGLTFTLLLTRNLSQADFGVWSNIFTVMGYFTIASGLLPFWTTRFAARKMEGAVKTAFLATLVIAFIGVAVYIPFVFLYVQAAKTQEVVYLTVYLLASLAMLNVYLVSLLESSLRVVKSQAVGYGLLVEEVTKVTVALSLLLTLGFSQVLLIAMVSLVSGVAVQVLYYVRLLAPDLKEKVHWNYLRQWLKGSTANIYNAVGGQLFSFMYILLFLSSVGKAATGDIQAAVTFANIIGDASFVSYAVYPKLLANSASEQEVTLSFKTTLMAAFPLAAIALCMPTSLLTILNVQYSEAWPVLVLCTFDALIVLILNFYSSLVLGAERLDEKGNVPLSELVRSKIFKVFTLPYIQAVIALPIAYYLLSQFTPSSSAVQAATYVVAIIIGVHVTTFTWLYLVMRKSIRLTVDWKSVGKYVFAAVLAAIILVIIPKTTTLVLTFGKVVVGLVTYSAVLLAIDEEARKLPSIVFQEIKTTLGGIKRK
jgi:O-antigen/teichoic acid export membrane protein